MKIMTDVLSAADVAVPRWLMLKFVLQASGGSLKVAVGGLFIPLDC